MNGFKMMRRLNHNVKSRYMSLKITNRSEKWSLYDIFLYMTNKLVTQDNLNIKTYSCVKISLKQLHTFFSYVK